MAIKEGEIYSLTTLKVLTRDQQRKNGSGPQILPCDDCKKKDIDGTIPCTVSEGPMQERVQNRIRLICPLQKGHLRLVYSQ